MPGVQRHPEDEALISEFPQLGDLARVAVLLNPTSGAPGAGDSSVGGPLLWPFGEPWPECSVGHWVYHREPLSEAERREWQEMDEAREMRARNGTGQRNVVTHEEAAAQKRIMKGASALDMITWERISTRPDSCTDPVAMVPVIQLHACDVPRAFEGRDADLLQVLWCPNDHDREDVAGGYPYGGPRLELRWRRSAEETLLPAAMPRPRRAAETYIPRPCTLSPVEARDFPEHDELPDGLQDVVEARCEEQDLDYHDDFACLGGWKIGGWPSWHLTDLQRIICSRSDCGRRMQLFLTVDSGGDPSVSVGRFGELRVFVCPDGPDHPIALNIQ
ncbi:hypothetical protein [Embleya sp. NBC_00896]|uniref:hypothetical protein n=1 Tax=Embleya sp. NBC_00896 TaxID=2975961 RepID=UPI00386CF856|nr:hypothetical protein OG928_34105 [Embleya sp. NBC_00896]